MPPPLSPGAPPKPPEMVRPLKLEVTPLATENTVTAMTADRHQVCTRPVDHLLDPAVSVRFRVLENGDRLYALNTLGSKVIVSAAFRILAMSMAPRRSNSPAGSAVAG